METLSKDCCCSIFKFLSLSDLLRVRLACRRFSAILLDAALLSRAVMARYSACSVWGDVVDELRGPSLESIPLLGVPVADSEFSQRIKAIEKMRSLLYEVDEGDGEMETLDLLAKALFLLGPLVVNMRDMGSFTGGGAFSPFDFLSEQDLTLLHYAVVLQNEQLVRALLHAGASPNIECHDADGYGQNTLSWTPLCCASFLGNANIVRMLLLSGACVSHEAFLLEGYDVEANEKTYCLKELYGKAGKLRKCNPAELAAHNNHEYVARILSSPILSWIHRASYFAPVFDGKFHGSSGFPQGTFHSITCPLQVPDRTQELLELLAKRKPKK